MLSASNGLPARDLWWSRELVDRAAKLAAEQSHLLSDKAVDEAAQAAWEAFAALRDEAWRRYDRALGVADAED